MDRVQVRHKNAHHWGTSFAGITGRVYYIHPQTGFLHVSKGKAFHQEAGCHPDDAEEYGRFEHLFEIDPAPPKKALPPKRTETPESGDLVPPEMEVKPPIPPPTLQAVPFPSDDDSKKVWYQWAQEQGIEMTQELLKLKKVDLLETIKALKASEE